MAPITVNPGPARTPPGPPPAPPSPAPAPAPQRPRKLWKYVAAGAAAVFLAAFGGYIAGSKGGNKTDSGYTDMPIPWDNMMTVESVTDESGDIAGAPGRKHERTGVYVRDTPDDVPDTTGPIERYTKYLIRVDSTVDVKSGDKVYMSRDLARRWNNFPKVRKDKSGTYVWEVPNGVLVVRKQK